METQSQAFQAHTYQSRPCDTETGAGDEHVCEDWFPPNIGSSAASISGLALRSVENEWSANPSSPSNPGLSSPSILADNLEERRSSHSSVAIVESRSPRADAAGYNRDIPCSTSPKRSPPIEVVPSSPSYHQRSLQRSLSFPSSQCYLADTNHGVFNNLLSKNPNIPTVLWPLPKGDPVLPMKLKAIPYPTIDDVRAPAIPPEPMWRRRHLSEPRFADLLHGIPPNLPETEVEKRSNKEIVNEGYEEGSEWPFSYEPLPLESASWEALQGGAALGRGTYGVQPVVYKPYGTPMLIRSHSEPLPPEPRPGYQPQPQPPAHLRTQVPSRITPIHHPSPSIQPTSIPRSRSTITPTYHPSPSRQLTSIPRS